MAGEKLRVTTLHLHLSNMEANLKYPFENGTNLHLCFLVELTIAYESPHLYKLFHFID